MDFAPLKIQTRFSPLLSTLEPADLGPILARAGFRVAGVADRGVLFGAACARRGMREAGLSLAAGAEVVVWFRRPGGDVLPSAYTLTLFPISEEGRGNLDRLLERIAGEDRPPRLRGVADFSDIEDLGAGLLCLSGGLTGPLSGAWARGRAADALRAARDLAGLFGRDRFFLEVTRVGAREEKLVEPFLRDLASRLALRRAAADPIRFVRVRERDLLKRVRSLHPRPLPGGPPDAFLENADAFLHTQKEMAERYAGDPEPLETSGEILRLSAALSERPPDPLLAGETVELVRLVQEETRRRESGTGGWKAREVEARVFEDIWGIEDARLRGAVLHLSRIFRSARRARHGALLSTPFLSGTLLGSLAGLQETESVENALLPSADRGARERIVIEADQESAEILARLLVERLPGCVFPDIVPRMIEEVVKEKTIASLPRSRGEGSGPDPHPPTANPSGPGDRGNRSPDPLSEAEARAILDRVVAGYERSPRDLCWARAGDDPWAVGGVEEAGALRIRVRRSPLLSTLRAACAIEGEGNPFEGIRRGEWTGILEGGLSLSRELVAAVQPRTEDDLVLLLAAGTDRGPRRDLVQRIAAVRAGARPAPVRIPRLGPVLRETDGVPFFQEQMVSMIRVLASCSRRIAETLFRDLRVPPGPRLARERSLFVRRAVDRGLDPATANRVFSLLLALAPHAPRRGEVLSYARRVLRAAGRKATDPAGFAAAALNAVWDDRKRMHLLWAGFRREGIRFLPLDRNASEHLFRVEGEALRIGFGTLAGVTREIGDAIVEERERGGSFASEADLLRRLAALRIPRTALEEAARAFSRVLPAESASGDGVREGGTRASGSVGPSRGMGRHSPRTGARGRRGREQTSFSFLKGGEGGSIDGRFRRPLSENREEK